MTVISFDADAHRALQMLLPWYATNSLDDDEAARVDAHLAGCPGCRPELALERRLQAAQALATHSGDVERGLCTMRALLRSAPRRAAERSDAVRRTRQHAGVKSVTWVAMAGPISPAHRR